MSWLMHVLGLTDPGSPYYLFWSGIGSDIGELALVGALIHGFTKLRHQKSLHHMEILSLLRNHHNG